MSVERTVRMAGPGASLGASTGGNTAGTTGTVSLQAVLVGMGANTLSQSIDAGGNATLSISAPAPATISMWPEAPQSWGLTPLTATASMFATAAGTTTMTADIFPIQLGHYLSANQIDVPIQMSHISATTTANWSFTAGHSFAIYSLNGASLSLVSSFSNEQRLSYLSSTNATVASASFAMSFGSGAALSQSTSFSTNNAGNTSLWTSISNTKMLPFAIGAFSLSPGMYWGAFAYSQRTSGANLGSVSQVGLVSEVIALMPLELGKNVASTTVQYPLNGRVSMSQTNTAMPVSIATTAIKTASNNASWVNRWPAIQMVSQL
jgi:hypothetical protein